MASTLTKLLIHITFSTKNRAQLILPEVEHDLYAYVGGICRNAHSPLLAIGGTADHIHLLVKLGKTTALSDLLLGIKRDSARWVNENRLLEKPLHWQRGYFAFSIGQSGVMALRTYIANQKEHHKSMAFKDEVRAFFRKYGVEYDDKYVWD
ncbi:MAG: IS200/IS605 family transposase [Planctomycetes bacterium]|nr:IS200/IS605 family transposase [Planctomycetota bacterium]